MYIEYAKTFSEIFSLGNVCSLIIASVINVLILCFVSYKFLQILQQCGYRSSEYIKWYKKKGNAYKSRIFMLVVLSTLAFLLIGASLLFLKGPISIYVGLIAYVIFVVIYYLKDKQIKKKVPLKFTRRMIRLTVTYLLIMLLMSFAVLLLTDMLVYAIGLRAITRIRKVVVCFTPFMVPFAVLLAHWINLPLETHINSSYIKKCKTKLASYKNLIKIGITGSYGKTSVKNVLATILGQKYKVVSTPKSFNTPLGISKAVKYLDDTTEVFIAEMGARRQGDIKQLTEIVNPDYAVLCGINNQHLETFGSLRIIKNTKFELVEYMNGGTAVFYLDSPATKELFDKCTIDKIGAGVKLENSPTVYAKDVVYGKNGSSFTLCIDKESIKCSTSLLGVGNVSNICIASAVAYKMGLTLSEICAGISAIEFVPHRLQVLEGENGCTVIDDSYNSNPEGCRMAIDIMQSFSGQKIIVTPGLVELGKDEDKENYSVGQYMADKVDYAVLIGHTGAYKIRDGLIENGFNPDNVIKAKDVKEAVLKLKELATKDSVILFENDLPDKFA